jgi:ribulose kinase
LIGLDLGSSSVKGVLLDLCGNLLAEVSRENRLLTPQAGWVELDSAAHLENVCGILRELSDAAPDGVLAVAMAAASGNTLLTTAAGEPLGNIISWMDQRAAAHAPAALSGLETEAVRRVTGWPCVNSFPLAHLAWLQENRPDLVRRAGHVGMDTDWLLHQLTGRCAWTTRPPRRFICRINARVIITRRFSTGWASVARHSLNWFNRDTCRNPAPGTGPSDRAFGKHLAGDWLLRSSGGGAGDGRDRAGHADALLRHLVGGLRPV